jgi:hypothetical protein
MIFICSCCHKEYDEKNEEDIFLGLNDCKMICYKCSKLIMRVDDLG